MKQRKVKSVRFHTGVQFLKRKSLSGVMNSLDTDVHPVEMEVWPMGIKISVDGIETVVSYADVISFDLLPE